MPIETAGDRAIFVDPEEFGAVATWTADGQQAVDVNCLFDDGYLLLAGDLDDGQEGSQPRILMRSADIPAGAAKSDPVTVTSDVIDGGSQAYVAVSFEPDGSGMTAVRLMEA